MGPDRVSLQAWNGVKPRVWDEFPDTDERIRVALREYLGAIETGVRSPRPLWEVLALANDPVANALLAATLFIQHAKCYNEEALPERCVALRRAEHFVALAEAELAAMESGGGE